MRQLTESERDAIDAVLDGFEAERVQKAMECLDWRWSFDGWKDEVPDVAGIRRYLRARLRDVVLGEFKWTKSGGFVTSLGADGCLRAAFEVATAEYDPAVGAV